MPHIRVLLHEALLPRGRAGQARHTLEEEGLTFRSDSGMVRRHPCIRVEKDASGLFVRIWSQLGLNWR
jgi:phage terminase small subunit